MIHQAWNLHTKGSRGAQLNNKLANVKKEAIGWNKSVFGKVELEIKKKLAELQEMQDSIVSIEDVRKEKILREELEGLLNKEEIMCAQRLGTIGSCLEIEILNTFKLWLDKEELGEGLFI